MEKGIAVELKEDLYELLDLSVDATREEIVKAYRKRALKCHPDKNPDNPQAAEEFLKISKALEILTDIAAKAAYDRLRRAKQAAKERTRKLDAKRQKLRADLEAREKAALNKKEDELTAAQKLKAEIERLRKEGSQLLRHEQELVAEQIKLEKERLNPSTGSPATSIVVQLKVKWFQNKEEKCSTAAKQPMPYTDVQMKEIFSKYGSVNYVVISKKKANTALIEMTSDTDIEKALMEIGLPDCPLEVSLVGGNQTAPAAAANTEQKAAKPESAFLNKATSGAQSAISSQLSDRDFESLVLMELRRKEERKRLIAEMIANDNNDDTNSR